MTHLWLFFVASTIVCWGSYGPSIHEGQLALAKNAWKAFLCVGGAYFLIAVVFPLIILLRPGGDGLSFNSKGLAWASTAGALGALGALFIILALKNGGKPAYVMPLVFGGAPLVNVLVSMALHPPKEKIHPMLYVGFAVAAIGAFLVLRYKPN